MAPMVRMVRTDHTAPMDNGKSTSKSHHTVGTLILTLTRQCNLRCAYCPTVKEGWPSLTKEQAQKSIEIFLSLFGSGDIKLFGGEPFLNPEVLLFVLEYVRNISAIRHVYVSTNGSKLSPRWLEILQNHRKTIVTVSMDGLPKFHQKLRRNIGSDPDSYDVVVSYLPELLKVPRLVVTQTVAPSMAKHFERNFLHLRELGFKRFNFLPGYYLPWTEDQLMLLRNGFDSVSKHIEISWLENQYIYVRNLFVKAPTPFFNQGLIVDADASIHPCNVGLSGSFDSLLSQTKVGDLEQPPTLEALQESASQMNALIQQHIPEHIWQSTLAADAELTRFCDVLLPKFLAYRQLRQERKYV